MVTRPNGQNDRVGKLKEIIANTKDNIVQTEEILATQPLTDEKRRSLEHTNDNREDSLREFQSNLREDQP